MAEDPKSPLFLEPDLATIISLNSQDGRDRISHFRTPGSVARRVQSHIGKGDFYPERRVQAYGSLAIPFADALIHEEDLSHPYFLHGGACNLGESLEVPVQGEQYGCAGVLDILERGTEVPSNIIWGIRVEKIEKEIFSPHKLRRDLFEVLERARNHSGNRRLAMRVCDTPDG